MDFKTACSDSQTFVYSDSGGDGPLVVMFQGFPDLPFGWSDARDALVGAGQGVVVPYLRGYHPDTMVPGRRYGAKEIAEDAIKLLDAIEAERAVLVGHDWGADRPMVDAPQRLPVRRHAHQPMGSELERLSARRVLTGGESCIP